LDEEGSKVEMDKLLKMTNGNLFGPATSTFFGGNNHMALCAATATSLRTNLTCHSTILRRAGDTEAGGSKVEEGVGRTSDREWVVNSSGGRVGPSEWDIG
jgi:hypothetical protein